MKKKDIKFHLTSISNRLEAEIARRNMAIAELEASQKVLLDGLNSLEARMAALLKLRQVA